MSRTRLTTDAEKKTAYMHGYINQTKPKDVENSGAIVRVGITIWRIS